ncbi:hypothetical protein ACEPPN_000392 [Leptodophora sp. 'Broadleaf-Isolate-01']
MTSVHETSRTAIDRKRLRDKTAEIIAGREDVELEEDETMGGRKRVYPEACGAVVDKSSAKGIVVITAHGFPVQQVDTGLGLTGEAYAELTIGVGIRKGVLFSYLFDARLKGQFVLRGSSQRMN